MRLTAIELENVRRFRGRFVIETFGPRLNVLCGPNEFGKSTLLAALSAAFFQKHGSRSRTIMALQTAGSETAPRVAVTFRIGDMDWRLEKQFLAKASASLADANGRRFEGDAAETRLRELLGVDAGGKPEHLGLWDALWVTQGASFSQAAIEAGLARTTIAECLEAELGGVAGFGRGDTLLRQVENALSSLRDRFGKPAGERKQLGVELAKLEIRIADLTARRDALGDTIAEWRALEITQDRLRARIDRDAERNEISGLREALAQARTREANRDAAASALNAARAEHGQALDAVAARQAARAAVEAGDRSAAEASRVSKQAADESDEAARALARARIALGHAEQASRDADRAFEAARRAEAAGTDRQAFADASHRLEQARLAEDALAKAAAALALRTVDRTAIEAIRKAVRALHAERDRLGSQATVVDIDALPGAPLILVSTAGAPPSPASNRLTVVDDTELRIEGVGVIRIRPAIADRDKTQRRLDDARRALAALLAGHGLETPDEAEAAFEAHEQAAAILARRQQDLARLVDDTGVAGLAVKAETLAARLADIADAPTGDAEIAYRLRGAEAARAEAEQALVMARARQETASSRAAALKATAAGALANAETAITEALKRKRALDLQESEKPLLLLEAEAGEREAELTRAAARRAALETAGDAPDAGSLEIRIARLEESVTNRDDEARRTDVKLVTLRARIDAEGGAGIDEALAAAAREREGLAKRLAALDREAATLALLADTLRATVGEARAATMLPLTRRIAPRLARLLPGASLSCDDDFKVNAVLRGPNEEPFATLSDGTREQIAILTRLAYADMLVDRGKPAMVVLDDALAFSDENRIERMFDILTEAATRVQIIVLTCRADLFARLGGTRLSLEAA